MRHEAKLVVKGKSMTSEEIRLNHALKGGIKVAETDLAEFILQVADEQPSHIIGPALHYSRERITALFKKISRPTCRSIQARNSPGLHARNCANSSYRRRGISGANFIAADTGSLMLVESEGNIRMMTTLPPLHIAIAGIEKVIPSREDFGTFLELLLASDRAVNYVVRQHPHPR